MLYLHCGLEHVFILLTIFTIIYMTLAYNKVATKTNQKHQEWERERVRVRVQEIEKVKEICTLWRCFSAIYTKYEIPNVFVHVHSQYHRDSWVSIYVQCTRTHEETHTHAYSHCTRIYATWNAHNEIQQSTAQHIMSDWEELLLIFLAYEIIYMCIYVCI